VVDFEALDLEALDFDPVEGRGGRPVRRRLLARRAAGAVG